MYLETEWCCVCGVFLISHSAYSGNVNKGVAKIKVARLHTLHKVAESLATTSLMLKSAMIYMVFVFNIPNRMHLLRRNEDYNHN